MGGPQHLPGPPGEAWTRRPRRPGRDPFEIEEEASQSRLSRFSNSSADSSSSASRANGDGQCSRIGAGAGSEPDAERECLCRAAGLPGRGGESEPNAEREAAPQDSPRVEAGCTSLPDSGAGFHEVKYGPPLTPPSPWPPPIRPPPPGPARSSRLPLPMAVVYPERC